MTPCRGCRSCSLPGRAYPLEFRVDRDGGRQAFEWNDAERAADGADVDVLLVLR